MTWQLTQIFSWEINPLNFRFFFFFNDRAAAAATELTGNLNYSVNFILNPL